MTPSRLQQWIEHPETLNRESLYELRTLVARFPYAQTLRLLYLKNLYLLHDIDFGAELRRSVLYVTDRRALFYLIEGDRYALQPQTDLSGPLPGDGEEPGVDRTLSLIDAFLATVPDETSQEVGLDYTTDYTLYLQQSADAPDRPEEPEARETPRLRGQELIDDFISKSEVEKGGSVEIGERENEEIVEEPEAEEEEPAKTEEEILPDEGSYFTETLAKIYVKQHRYDKALEIIKKLSLNYPKKNAYFADQIRFLEKLIINDKSK